MHGFVPKIKLCDLIHGVNETLFRWTINFKSRKIAIDEWVLRENTSAAIPYNSRRHFEQYEKNRPIMLLNKNTLKTLV